MTVAVVVLLGTAPLAAVVYDAVNADKVDGRHAVGAGASAEQRAGKLVATNAAGRLPNTIIAKALNAELLDGQDSSVFQKQVTGSCSAVEKMTGVGTDAAVTCGADLVDGGDAATLNGVPSSELQRRVTGTCAVGEKVTAIGADGSVSCSVDEVDGGNATTIDGLDSTLLQRAGVRTVVVSPTGTPAANGSALLLALAQIPNTGDAAPSATNRWLVKVEPGTYDVTASAPLAMRPFVDIEGSGPSTVITCACNSSTVNAAADTILRQLKIVNSGTGAGSAGGVFATGAPAALHDLVIDVSGAPQGFGVNGSGALSIHDSTIDVSATTFAFGVVVNNGSHLVSNTRVHASGGSTFSHAVQPQFGAVTIEGSTLTADGSPENTALSLTNGATADVANSSLIGAATPDGRSVNEGSGTARIATSMLSGSVVSAPQCVHTYNAAYAALNATCQP